MNRYKCIIVEDEPLAQNVLRKYIEEHPSLELVAVCADAMEAQARLSRQPVEIMFLDINLPKLSGISFLKTLASTPQVIFTTAYPEFAVEGFELNAVDYLLKPFSFERFLKAVNKALLQLDAKHTNKLFSAESQKPGSLFLKADKKIHKVDLATIIYIEAVGDYIKVVSDTGTLLVNETLKLFQEELPGEFIRVHKSYIISTSRIRFIEGNIIRVAEKEIPIGATYKEDLLQFLEKKK